jgi:hypothetical protein
VPPKATAKANIEELIMNAAWVWISPQPLEAIMGFLKIDQA